MNMARFKCVVNREGASFQIWDSVFPLCVITVWWRLPLPKLRVYFWNSKRL